MNDNDDTLRAINSIEHFARALLKQPNSMATATGTQMIADAILTNVAVLRSRASVAAVGGDAEDRAKAIVELVENLRLQHAKRKHHGPFESCTSYSICALANRISVAAVSSPAPAEPPKLVPEVDQWKHDLTTAGWIAETALNWRAPDGSLWRGPAGAWKELQRRTTPQRESVQWSPSVDDWPIPSVLGHLADATEHLLRDHECDCCGWETWKYAAEAAQKHIALLSAPAEPLQPTGEQEENDRLWCGGCLRYLDDEHPCVCKPAAPPPTTPSDAAMRAAEEIAESEAHYHHENCFDKDVERVAAIITRHLPATPPHSVVNFEAWTSIDKWLRDNPQATEAECLAELVKRIKVEAASTEATPNYALVQLLNAAMLHPEQAEGYIRRVIAELGDASPETPVGGESGKCVKCGSADVRQTQEGVKFCFSCKRTEYADALKCVKCGHVKLNPWRGYCKHETGPFGKRPVTYCGCKCEFPSPVVATVSDEELQRLSRLSMDDSRNSRRIHAPAAALRTQEEEGK